MVFVKDEKMDVEAFAIVVDDGNSLDVIEFVVDATASYFQIFSDSSSSSDLSGSFQTVMLSV
jgi:hypothetical protein